MYIKFSKELKEVLQVCEGACFERYPLDYRYHDTPEKMAAHIYKLIEAGMPEPPLTDEELRRVY